MSVEEFLVGWSRRGIVVDAGAFHTRAVTFGGRVVESEEQALARAYHRQHATEQAHGDPADATTEAAKEVVMRAEVIPDVSGP